VIQNKVKQLKIEENEKNDDDNDRCRTDEFSSFRSGREEV
jgi:hypothetical protein